VDATTKPRMAYRDVLIGLLTGLDDFDWAGVETDGPDVEKVLHAFLDDLAEANPFDVALAAFELITRLAADVGQWTGQSRAETLRDLAAAVATNPTP
jgi:hypothetical protein